jgi:hypothetical protein
VLMCYEIEESGGYFAARDLLVRRCEAWAETNGLALSPLLAAALLDSRHFSSDGRLGYWTPAQVSRALLEWIPEKVTAPEGDLLDAPETLRSLLRYLDTHGLRDPRAQPPRRTNPPSTSPRRSSPTRLATSSGTG